MLGESLEVSVKMGCSLGVVALPQVDFPVLDLSASRDGRAALLGFLLVGGPPCCKRERLFSIM